MNVHVDDEELRDFEQEGYSWECKESSLEKKKWFILFRTRKEAPWLAMSTTGTLGTHKEIQQSHHMLVCCFVGMS